MQIRPVKFGPHDSLDVGARLLLHDEPVDAIAQGQRAVAVLPHLGLGGHDAMTRHDGVEIQLQRRVECGRPFLRAPASRVVDELRRRIAEREHVTGCQRPLGREVRDHVAVGVGAVGLIIIGPLGIGVISFGGFGIIAFQGVGIVSLGGAGLGVIALGGAACGVVAIGGAALGYVAIGGGAMGVYVLGASGKGRYVLTKRRQDPEAVAFFGRWVPGVRTKFTAA